MEKEARKETERGRRASKQKMGMLTKCGENYGLDNFGPEILKIRLF